MRVALSVEGTQIVAAVAASKGTAAAVASIEAAAANVTAAVADMEAAAVAAAVCSREPRQSEPTVERWVEEEASCRCSAGCS